MGKLPWFKMFSSSWLTDPRLSRCSSSTRGIWIDLICSMHEDGQIGVLKGTAEELSRVARCSPQEFILAMTEISIKGVGDVSPCPPYVPHASLEFTVINRRMSRENTKKVFERNKKQNQRVRSKINGSPANVPQMSPDLSPSMSPAFPGERLEVRGKRLDKYPPISLARDRPPSGSDEVKSLLDESQTDVQRTFDEPSTEAQNIFEGEEPLDQDLGFLPEEEYNKAMNVKKKPKAAKKPRAYLVTEEFWVKIRENPAYSRINLEKENGKMDAWLMKKGNGGRKKTESFVLNWLNKALEDPKAAPPPKKINKYAYLNKSSQYVEES